MKPVKRVLITTGDVDGIGFEITAKALNKIGPKKIFSFIILKTWLLRRNTHL